MFSAWVPLIAFGLATLMQVAIAIDGWRKRREREEVKAVASDDLLSDRMKRAEARIRDLERSGREAVHKDDFARLEGRVDDLWAALRKNGHPT